ncbi:hypothetical protein BSTAB16_7563 [Burkholderia stabilis]|uniref:Uncharacterized protein n=1 Tax=Burkholderia stabilis TaxID=95485 RepID=A0AAJ5NJX5_9BURK|nr:hypothetical protein BSTAB16_7563 [Burkholderia stabilis]
MLPSDFPDQAFSVQPSTRALARGSASGSPRRQGTRGLGSRVIVAMTALVLAGGAVSPTAFAKGSGFSSSSSRSSYSSGSSRSSYSSSYSSSSSSSRSSYSSPSYGSSSYSSSSNRSSSSSPSYGGSSYNSTSSKSTYSSPSYSSPSNSGSSSSSTSERSSYTAPNYSGSSYSASSQPSTPSQATPPKTSGFTSSGTSKVIAATALGGALYAAQSGHDAAATLSANQAAHGSANVTTPSSISNGSTVSQGATKSAPPAPANVPSSNSRSSPQTVVVHNSGGNDGLLLGYMLGSAGSRHDTVVVQQPAPQVAVAGTASSAIASRDNSADADPLALAANDPAQASSAKAAQEPMTWLDRVMVTVLALGVLAAVIMLVMRLRTAWKARQSRFTSSTNYRL